jgi:alpha-beta hydrolase superfamily lysophospholipase
LAKDDLAKEAGIMDHQEGHFEGVRNTQIYYQAWLPDGEPKAAVLIVHGLAEHSGRYANVVEHMVPLGYALYALDHVGHGRSEGQRAYVDRFDEYISTLHLFVGMVRGWLSAAPLFMLGHSMGSLICINYVLDHPADLAGVVLSGTSVQMPDSITPLTLVFAKALSALVPRMGLQALESTHISRDPDVVQAYVNDPLVYTGAIPARTGVEMLNAQQRAMAEASKIALPILMVHGSEDRLTPLAGARAFYEALGSEDKTFREYAELFHEVCNEPECGMVLSDIAAWLNAHLEERP